MLEKDKIYSVTELNIAASFSLNQFFGNLTIVEGEISQISVSQMGHHYISLVDEESSISCTLWKSKYEKLSIKPKVGMKVLIKGKINIYSKTGSFQLDIQSIRNLELGKFQLAFEKLKEKLKKEGFFEESNKKQLIQFPKNIAVITSPTGSVIKDIIKIIERRHPFSILHIYSCYVQGDKCSSSICNRLVQIRKKNDVDAIIIARGGGSIEDLIEYNNEDLARHIYKSKIPIITAIGHETDTTIADLVSDIRAATPSEAAEIVTPISIDSIKENLLEKKSYLNKQFEKNISHNRNFIDLKKSNMKNYSPLSKINNYYQTLDHLLEKLNQYYSGYIESKLKEKELLQNSLIQLNPLKILKRGYTVTYNSSGKSIKSYKECLDGDLINTRLDDGYIKSKVTKSNKD